MPVRYLTIPKFAAESGYTEDAVRTKIRDNIWPERMVWVKAPDGRVLIDTEGYNEWAESGTTMAFERPRTPESKSTFTSRAGAAASASNSSPPPLT